SGCHGLRVRWDVVLHLVEKPTYPPVTHRGRGHTGWLAAGHQLLFKRFPARIPPSQPLGGLDDRDPKIVPRLTPQAGIGLACAAGTVAGRHAAVTRHLFAAAKPLESADLR